MDGTKFPIAIFIEFQSPQYPLQTIKNDVAKLLISVQQNMVSSEETIQVLTPAYRELAFLTQLVDCQVEPVFTSDLDKLLNGTVEICSIYTDHTTYADEISKICKEHDIVCNSKVFVNNDQPFPFKPNRKFELPGTDDANVRTDDNILPDRVSEKSSGLKVPTERLKRKLENKSASNASLSSASSRIRKDRTVTGAVADVSGEYHVPRKALPRKGIVRTDGVIQNYHISLKKKKELEQHELETSALLDEQKRQREHYKTLTDPIEREEHHRKLKELTYEIDEREKTKSKLTDAYNRQKIITLNTNSDEQTVSSAIAAMLPNVDLPSSRGHGYITSRHVGDHDRVTLFSGVYDGQEEPITPFELHKIMKGGYGGPSDKWVEDYAQLVVNRVLEDPKMQIPDQILVPPVTWSAADAKSGKWNSPEEKADSLIHVRVAKRAAELFQSVIRGEQGSISLADIRKHINKGTEIDQVEMHGVKFDPLALGTKNFEVKKTNSRVTHDKRVAKIRKSYEDDIFGKIDRGEISEDFGKNVLVLDDNIDTGITFDLLKELIEGLSDGTKVSTLALFNMKPGKPPGQLIDVPLSEAEQLAQANRKKQRQTKKVINPEYRKFQDKIKSDTGRKTDIDTIASRSHYENIGHKLARGEALIPKKSIT